jgi:carbon monoxide dehydrogenase subunit G
MEFDNSFTVQKPIDEVWNTMIDLEWVVPAVPGARVIEKTGDQRRVDREPIVTGSG